MPRMDENEMSAMPLLDQSTYSGDKKETAGNPSPVHRSVITQRKARGVDPYHADQAYLFMGSRAREEISTPVKKSMDIFCIIKSDNRQDLEESFSQKSAEEGVDFLVQNVPGTSSTCIQMAVEFRSLLCLDFLLDVARNWKKKFQEMGMDLLRCFSTDNGENNIFHTIAARPFDPDIFRVLEHSLDPDLVSKLMSKYDENDNTPLLISTKREDILLSSYLVEFFGAEADAINHSLESPIGICLRNGTFDLLFAFLYSLQKDKNLSEIVQNGKLFNGHTLLFPLLTNNQISGETYESLRYILSNDLLKECIEQEVKSMEFLRKFCFHCSSLNAINDVTELMPDFSTVKDEDDMTPLMWACSQGNMVMVNHILSRPDYEQVIKARENGKNFIHHCIQFNCLKRIETTIRLKLQDKPEFLELLNDQDDRGFTPLHYAVTGRYFETVKTLLSFGASHDLIGPPPYNRSMLHYAAFADGMTVNSLLDQVKVRYGDKAMTELLNKGDYRMETAMHLAANTGNTDVVRSLIQREASTKSDYKGRTPLHAAAASGSIVVASLLLNYEAKLVDKEDHKGKTALMVAAEKGSSEVAKLLLSRQAKITNDKHGNNCLDYAVDNRWPETALAIIDTEPPIWKEVLDTCRNGSQDIMSRMVRTMDSVACSVLSKCVTCIEEDGSEKLKIHYDFFLFAKPSTARCSPFVQTMVENSECMSLQHRVVKKFLDINSTRVRSMYYTSLAIYLLFLISFTSYIGITRQGSVNLTSPRLLFLTVICLLISVFCLLIEISQFISGKIRYIKEKTNYLELTLYISTIIFFVPVWSEKSTKQWHAGAIAIFLAWIRFIWFLKFFSLFGIYIIMVKRVFLTVLKVLPLVLLFLIAFAMSFFVMFPKDEGFSSFPLSFILGLVMMTGEIDFRGTFLENKSSEFFELRLVTMILFLLLVLIVLMNLFTGLAVGDTSECLQNSKHERRWQQADYLLGLERMAIFFRHSLSSSIEYRDRKTFRRNTNAGSDNLRKPRRGNKPCGQFLRGLKDWLIPKNVLEDDDDDEMLILTHDNTQPEFEKIARRFVEMEESVDRVHKNIILFLKDQEKRLREHTISEAEDFQRKFLNMLDEHQRISLTLMDDRIRAYEDRLTGLVNNLTERLYKLEAPAASKSLEQQ